MLRRANGRCLAPKNYPCGRPARRLWKRTASRSVPRTKAGKIYTTMSSRKWGLPVRRPRWGKAAASDGALERHRCLDSLTNRGALVARIDAEDNPGVGSYCILLSLDESEGRACLGRSESACDSQIVRSEGA